MKDKQQIEKIVNCINKILQYTEGVSQEEFEANSMLVEACVFNLSQIGELANKVSPEFQDANPSIPWRMVYGLRNRIVHNYEGVNLVLIWDIVCEDLPELLNQLKKLI